MLKSFILAATSIAYILSAVNIADAKITKSNKVKVFTQDLGCQNPVKPNPLYNRLIIKTPELKEDIKSICQVITKTIGDFNKDSLAREQSSNPAAKIDQEMHALEIKDIKIIGWNKDKYGSSAWENDSLEKRSKIYAEIVAIQRTYLWDNNGQQWKLTRTKNYTDYATFSKDNGQWTQTEHKVY
jgi:opacity protein-like surface antigen